MWSYAAEGVSALGSRDDDDDDEGRPGMLQGMLRWLRGGAASLWPDGEDYED